MESVHTNRSFVEGFEAVTGRKPTQADYERYQEHKRTGGRPVPNSKDKVGAILGPLAGVGGLYAGTKVLGGVGSAAGGAAASAGAGAAGAASAAPAAPAILGAKAVGSGAGGAGVGSSGLGAGAGLGVGAGVAAGGALLAKGLYDSYKDNETQGPVDALARAQALTSTGGLSEVGRLVGSDFTTGKDSLQQKRDSIRGALQDHGILDDNYGLGGVDLGKDGGFRFDDGSRVYEAYAGQEDGSGQVDELTGERIGALNPLGFLLAQGDEEAQGYTVGMLSNALKHSDEEQDLKSLYDKVGGYDQVFSAVGDAANAGQLELEDAHAYQNALNKIYGQDAYVSGGDRALESGAQSMNHSGEVEGLQGLIDNLDEESRRKMGDLVLKL